MGDIEKSRITEIVSLYQELITSLKTSFEKALRIGELLAQQKASMKHGEFMPWLEKNLSFITDRTARRWMTLHKNRGRLKMDSVSDLTTAYKLLEATKEFPNEERPVIKMDNIEPNPFFDLSKIPGEAIQHWVNVLDQDFCQPLPYWTLAVRKHKDKYQLICDHDRWAGMKLAGRKDAAVHVVENMSDKDMKWYLETFDNKWYLEYVEYLKLKLKD